VQREHGVRAGRALVHERRRDRALRVCRGGQRAHLRGRTESLHHDVRDSRRTLFVLDLVPFLVEFAFAEEFVDCARASKCRCGVGCG
jgi:hypothetical protein